MEGLFVNDEGEVVARQGEGEEAILAESMISALPSELREANIPFLREEEQLYQSLARRVDVCCARSVTMHDGHGSSSYPWRPSICRGDLEACRSRGVWWISPLWRAGDSSLARVGQAACSVEQGAHFHTSSVRRARTSCSSFSPRSFDRDQRPELSWHASEGTFDHPLTLNRLPAVWSPRATLRALLVPSAFSLPKRRSS